MRRATKMRVVTVDKNGNQLGDAEWIDIPPPESFAKDRFAHIHRYVIRLLKSSASFTSVIIATPDEDIAVSLSQRDGVPKFRVSVEWRQEPELERAIRQFCADRTLTPCEDYLAGNGDVSDATRYLSYVLPADARFITTLVKDVLRQVYGVRDKDALDFDYEESTRPPSRAPVSAPP